MKWLIVLLVSVWSWQGTFAEERKATLAKAGSSVKTPPPSHSTMGVLPVGKPVMGMLPSAEEWKGKSPSQKLSAGFLGGLSLNGASSLGGVFLGHAAVQVVERGFIGGELNDQVFLELQAGPEFFSTVTALGMSAHARWDFNRNEDFAVYALGGASFHFAPGFNQVHPRFGVGAIWFFEWFGVRAEISERWVLAGAHFSL